MILSCGNVCKFQKLSPWGRASLTKILLFNQLDLCHIMTTQFCVRFSATHKWVEILLVQGGGPWGRGSAASR